MRGFLEILLSSKIHFVFEFEVSELVCRSPARSAELSDFVIKNCNIEVRPTEDFLQR